MPAFPPVVDPVSLRPLFGGAIEAVFPGRFLDMSQIRDVPDHQLEMFADTNRDESIMVEILELKKEVRDENSANWFFQDLAIEQQADETITMEMTGSLSPQDVPLLDPSVVKGTAVGTLDVAKSRQGSEAKNLVRCYLANLRLKNVNTDILITLYEPLVISERSHTASVIGAGRTIPASQAGLLPASEVFKKLLSTFSIKDWNLFGESEE